MFQLLKVTDTVMLFFRLEAVQSMQPGNEHIYEGVNL